MATVIHAGEIPGGGEDLIIIFGLEPNKRWEIVLTYLNTGVQQFYGAGSNSVGLLQLSHPVYYEGDISVQILNPAAIIQVDDSPKAIQAYELPLSKRSPENVSRKEPVNYILMEELTQEIEDKIIEAQQNRILEIRALREIPVNVVSLITEPVLETK